MSAMGYWEMFGLSVDGIFKRKVTTTEDYIFGTDKIVEVECFAPIFIYCCVDNSGNFKNIDGGVD